MAIGALGTGSGVDLESLVKGLVSSQRDAKAAAFDRKIEDLSVELSAIGTSSASVSAFKNAVRQLNDPTLFNKRMANVKQPDSGDVISVRANSSAVSGRYNFDVLQLAQGSRTELLEGVYQSADDVITDLGGRMKFTAGNESFTVEVEKGTTLAELANLISEAQDNFGVTTSLIDTGLGDVRLIIMSDKMGVGNDMFVTAEENVSANPNSLTNLVSDAPKLTDLTSNLLSTKTAQNGIISIEGTQIQSENNIFDKAIKGLSIEALDLTESSVKTEITYDKESVKEAIGTLVDSYNKMISTFNDFTGMNGTLQGNSLLRGLEGSLNNALNKSFTGSGGFTSLYDIGIRLNNSGELTIDQLKLDDALASGFQYFADMFSGENGIATAFEQTLKPYTGNDGLFRTTQNSLQEQIAGTEDDMDSFEYRMEQYERRLRKQYTALDSNLAELNASGDYLRNQLASITG
ncbi:flagellar hook protein [Marinomonas agarivorans]|nr:flagellar hook protein [Marinomonas agarivorans]